MGRFLSRAVLAALLLAPAPVALAQTDAAEIEFWQSVKDSQSASELEAYLQAYPKGKFAPLARIRLKALKADAATSDRAGPPTASKTRPPGQADGNRVADSNREKTVAVKLERRPGQPNKAWLGVGIYAPSKIMAAIIGIEAGKGAVVSNVLKDSPADRAGMVPGAVIMSVDGVPITDPRMVVSEVGRHAAGETVSFGIVEATGSPSGYVALLRKAAGKGDAMAMSQLGQAYGNGIGIAKNETEAAYWFLKGAEGGDAFAMSSIGARYDNGIGVKEDNRKAVHWYRKAAEKGRADAMNSLGVMYFNGEGVRKDLASAAQWFRKAADEGDAEAMYNLGIVYENGNGVGKDRAEALKWYRKAAELGNADAIKYLRKLGVSIPPASGTKANAPGADLNLDSISKDLEKLD